MAEFDVDAMLERFRERAKAVQERGLPPVAGEGRKMLLEQAERDFTDFAMVGQALWEVEDGHLVLRIPLSG
jgi:hypothetical protein